MFNNESQEFQKPIFDDNWKNSEEEAIEHYSIVSIIAILSLIVGIFSLLYIINHSLLALPIAALAIAAWALYKIKRSKGTITGAGLARITVMLALAAITTVQIQNYIYKRQLILQGREFFSIVFDAAKRGDTLKLYQLLEYEPERKEVRNEVSFWNEKFSNPMESIGITSLIFNDTLKTLLALGDNAKITYDQTVETSKDKKGVDHVAMMYAVTYDDLDGKKTFFLPCYASRVPSKTHNASFWSRIEFDRKPLSIKEKGKVKEDN